MFFFVQSIQVYTQTLTRMNNGIDPNPGGSEELVRDSILLGEDPHFSREGGEERRIHTLKHRQHLVSDTVTLIQRLGIRTVIVVTDAAFLHEIIDIGSGELQQRTDKPHSLKLLPGHRDFGNFFHSGNAFEPSPAKKIQDQCLCIVIRIVGHRHGIIPMPAAEFGEPVIA